jgi:hypothetical protein
MRITHYISARACFSNFFLADCISVQQICLRVEIIQFVQLTCTHSLEPARRGIKGTCSHVEGSGTGWHKNQMLGRTMRLARAAKSMVPGLKSWEGKFLIFSLGNDLRHKSHWTFRPAWCFTTRKTVLVLEINVFELCSDASPARRGRRWRRPGRRWRGPRGI